jgi:cytochrome b561
VPGGAGGVCSVTHPPARVRRLAEQFFGMHSVPIWVLRAVVALHVVAALKHLLWDKDGVFERMTFGGDTRRRSWCYAFFHERSC